MEVRELLTTWGFKVDDKALKRLDGQLKSLTKSFAIIGAAGVAAGAALFGLAKSTAKSGDYFRKTSQAIGVNAELLQKMVHVATLGGLSQQELVNGMRLLANTMIDAGDGLETYLRSYRKLGITQDQLKSGALDNEAVILKVADAFSEMSDGAEKTAIAQDLFGRAGAKMIPMLNQGREAIAAHMKEAEELGFIFDEKLQVASEEFNDQLARMSYYLKGLKNYLGAQLIPIFNNYFERILKYIKANKELIRQRTIEYFYKLADAIKFVGRALFLYMTFKVAALVGSLAEVGLMTIKAAAGFKTLGNAALIMNLKLAATGLIILGILGLIEDVYSLMSGKKSIIGALVGETWEKRLQSIPDALADTAWDFKEAFKAIGAHITGKEYSPQYTAYDQNPALRPAGHADSGKPTNINVNVNPSTSQPYQQGREIGRGISDELQFMKAGLK